MAAYAAHLTRTLQGTPSLFQVTAQEALGATVKPALRKFVEYLAAVYPDKCGWCITWFDELYLLFDCCLQYHYLKHYAASFSEHFYGLLRVPLEASKFHSGQRLPVAAERASLAMLTLLPYLRDKAEQAVERWRADDDDSLLGTSRKDRTKRAAVHLYSVLHLVQSVARLGQLARYVSGRGPSHAPGLAALGLALRGAGGTGGTLAADLEGSSMITFPMLGALGLRVIEYGAFAVQFLRWWEGRGQGRGRALPAPAPPLKDEKSIRMKNKCPICLQSWKIPTVLPVSGLVFCYVCVARHLRTHGACPATGWPAGEGDLVRMYLDT